MINHSITAQSIASALHGKKAASGWIAKCPAHDDNSPSLSLSEQEGRISQYKSYVFFFLLKKFVVITNMLFKRTITCPQYREVWPDGAKVLSDYRLFIEALNAAEAKHGR